MRRAEIDDENRRQLDRQRQFRLAADIVVRAWMSFPEVQAIAVIGSVAGPLWKEVPRFSAFRRAGIEIWHECGDLDLALWLDSRHRLGDLRRAGALALRRAHEDGVGVSVADSQLDVFLFEPGSDRYLGRLSRFSQCPKAKPACLVPGCGETPFDRQVDGFAPHADILAPAAHALLYRREAGSPRSALDLPTAVEGDALGPRP